MSPPRDPSIELGEATAELERLVKHGERPTRYDARALLLPLGRLLLERGEEHAREALARIRDATRPPARGFRRAVREELLLAAAEHVRGVDPRFLCHPRFDVTYVVAARERLEQRLVAADALGVAPPEELLEQVAEADRLLAGAPRSRPDPG